jgi:hypothetical protein
MTRERTSRSRRRRGHAAAVTGADPSGGAWPAVVLSGLASVLLGIPLAVLSSPMGPYDDPKVWALSILMALTGLGWIVVARRRSASGSPVPDPWGRLVPGMVLVCTAWSLVATLTSVAPAQSVFGTFGRGVGLLTIGFAALAFFVIHAECRTPSAVRWIVDVALLGSVPVCLLALGQAIGWDPLPKAWDPAVRTLMIRSTFGTHVFLGSYLVVLIPLTLARLECALRERTDSGHWPAPSVAQWRRALTATMWVVGAVALIVLGLRWPGVWWALVPWGALGAVAVRLRADDVEGPPDTTLTVSLMVCLLAGQVLVVVLSQGRGAFIGILVGIGVTGFAFLFRHRAWKTLGAAAVASTALVVFLVLLNMPGSPIARLGKVRLLSRLGDITNVEQGSPGWVRLQLWSGIFDGWRRQMHGVSVIPGVVPGLRSFIGYGPETQLVVLEPLTAPFARKLSASGEGWYARYVFDRAHNVVLDRLVTEGFVGVALWALLLASVVVLGVLRLRSSAGPVEPAIRVGALGAILGHVADGQVGMATPVPLLLFWVAAALLTSRPWMPVTLPGGTPGEARSRTRWWAAALVAAALVASLIGWATTRWLFASMAYANGVRRGIAGQLSEAYGEFQRSAALAPWLPLPAESAAYTALRLATAESQPSRRIALLREADTLLRQARDHAIGGPGSWALRAQIAFAEARTGQPSQLATSRDAFAVALRLRPDDPRLLAQSAWVWLESGDPLQARRTAEQALAREPREWVAWAVLARVLKGQGDVPGTERATRHARDFAPAEARPLLDALLR